MLKEWSLGKNTAYPSKYNAELLMAIPRQLTRSENGISPPLPFKGVDIWNAWELSWLTSSGKPEVASARFQYSSDSEFLIESKSLKLYLNSLNQTKFDSQDEVLKTLEIDLSGIVNDAVEVFIYKDDDQWPNLAIASGETLDNIDITISDYDLNPSYLESATSQDSELISESLYSHLFKSNCMVTGQPDWASIFINYTGKPINHALLLKYLISFRNHQAFHEPCVEKIFVDLLEYCKPEALSVYCRYTRRGGLDINPYRSTSKFIPSNDRIWRQ